MKRLRSAPAAWTPAERRATRDAGGYGLSFFAAGINLIGLAVAALLVLVLLRAVLLDLSRSVNEVAFASVNAWLDGIDTFALWMTVLVVVIVAVLLCTVGVMISVRLLRTAGMEPAGTITWRGCVFGTALQVLLGLLTGWLLGLLWLLAGVLAPWLIVVVTIVLSIASSILIGYLAGPVLWRGQVRRARRLNLWNW